MEIMTSTLNPLSLDSSCREQIPILQINFLRKTYGKLVAVQNANFAVYPQQVFCLVGPKRSGQNVYYRLRCRLKKA